MEIKGLKGKLGEKLGEILFKLFEAAEWDPKTGIFTGWRPNNKKIKGLHELLEAGE